MSLSTAGQSWGIVRREPAPGPGDSSAAWAHVPALAIDRYLWLDNGYRPRVEVRLCHAGRRLHLRFEAFERRVLARFTAFQAPVYRDSCVEFFVDPRPEDSRGYFNFEFNALGTLLAAFGPGREDRRALTPVEAGAIEIAASVGSPVAGEYGAESWTVGCAIPFALLERLGGGTLGPGRRVRANFYKCGDDADPPHFGAWRSPLTGRPDFHRPECFGELLILP